VWALGSTFLGLGVPLLPAILGHFGRDPVYGTWYVVDTISHDMLISRSYFTEREGFVSLEDGLSPDDLLFSKRASSPHTFDCGVRGLGHSRVKDQPADNCSISGKGCRVSLLSSL
jgi:hypothetical protein